MRISVVLEALTGKFETDIDRSARKLQKALGNFDKEFRKVAKVGAAAFVAAGTAAAVFFERSVRAVADLQDLAEITGDTAEAIASLKPAADASGTSLEQVAAASVKLTAVLSKMDDETKGAGAAVAALGLDFEQFLKLSPVKRLDALARAFVQFEDGAQKTAIAVSLFGKSGAELLPFLNDLGQGFERQITLTQQQIEAADAFIKKQDAVIGQLGTLSQKLALELLPVAEDVVKVFEELTGGINGVRSASNDLAGSGEIREWAQDVAIALGVVLESVVALLKTFRAVGGSFESVAADIQVAGAAIARALVPTEQNRQDLERAIQERNRVIEEANRRYVELWNYNGTALTDALRRQFSTVRSHVYDLQSFLSDPQNQVQIPFLPGQSGEDGPLIFRNDGRRSLNFDPTPARTKTSSAKSEAQRADEQRLKSIQDLIKALEKEAAITGQTAEQISIYELNQLGATEADKERASQAIRMSEGIQMMAEATDQFRQVQDRLRSEADSLVESLRTPEEALEARREKLDELYNTINERTGQPFIDAETRTRELAAANDEYYESLKRLDPQLEETTDQLTVFAEQAGRNAQDALANFLFDPFEDGLRGMVRSFANALQQMAAQAAAAAIFKAIGGSVSPGSFLADFFLPGRAAGGPVVGGKAYMVGERGRELFIPEGPGRIVANDQLGGMGGNIRIVNQFEGQFIGDYIGSVPGERAIMNVVRRNATSMRTLLAAA